MTRPQNRNQAAVVLFGCLGFLAFATTACDQPAETESSAGKELPPAGEAAEPAQQARLITTLQKGGLEFKFYQHGDGPITIGQGGAYPLAPVPMTQELAAKSAVDIYRFLAPGQTVPDALTDASARFRRAVDSGQFGPMTRTPQNNLLNAAGATIGIGASGVPDQTDAWDGKCPRDYFQANHCYPGNRCWLNRTGRSKMAGSDASRFWGQVCPYRGAVAVRVFERVCIVCGASYVDDVVNEGRWQLYTIAKDGAQWDFSWEFTINGGGGGYHASGTLL
jgi:hypothetical protein